jgi:hypothetical protein
MAALIPWAQRGATARAHAVAPVLVLLVLVNRVFSPCRRLLPGEQPE